MTGDEVVLQLPGDPAYGRLGRIAATSVARRLPFTFRQIEDLALAVDEAVILVHQPPGTDIDRVEVRVRVLEAGLVVEVTAVPASQGSAPPVLDAEAVERFGALVEGTVRWEVSAEHRRVVLEAGPR